MKKTGIYNKMEVVEKYKKPFEFYAENSNALNAVKDAIN
jgi:hypothetical protein